MLLLNKIKTDLNLTKNEFIYEFVTTTRRLDCLAAQVEVTLFLFDTSFVQPLKKLQG
jgi:hypothetical protein